MSFWLFFLILVVFFKIFYSFYSSTLRGYIQRLRVVVIRQEPNIRPFPRYAHTLQLCVFCTGGVVTCIVHLCFLFASLQVKLILLFFNIVDRLRCLFSAGLMRYSRGFRWLKLLAKFVSSSSIIVRPEYCYNNYWVRLICNLLHDRT